MFNDDLPEIRSPHSGETTYEDLKATIDRMADRLPEGDTHELGIVVPGWEKIEMAGIQFRLEGNLIQIEGTDTKGAHHMKVFHHSALDLRFIVRPVAGRDDTSPKPKIGFA